MSRPLQRSDEDVKEAMIRLVFRRYKEEMDTFQTEMAFYEKKVPDYMSNKYWNKLNDSLKDFKLEYACLEEKIKHGLPVSWDYLVLAQEWIERHRYRPLGTYYNPDEVPKRTKVEQIVRMKNDRMKHFRAIQDQGCVNFVWRENGPECRRE